VSTNGAVRVDSPLDAAASARRAVAPASAGDERGVLSILRRWRWGLALSVVLGGTAAYIYASALSPTYQARAEILVGPLSVDPEAIVASRALTPTFASLADSRPVIEAAIREYSLRVAPADLASRVRATGVRANRLITIRVRGDDPEGAAREANAVAAVLVARSAPPPEPTAAPEPPRSFVWSGRAWREGELDEFVRFLGSQEAYGAWAADNPASAAILARRPRSREQERGEEQVRAAREAALARTARIVERAEPPRVRIRPDVGSAAQFGAAAALLALLGVALLGEQAGSRIRTGADLELASGIPVLGALDEPSGARPVGPEGAVSYRRLVGALQLAGPPPAPRTLIVLGADADAARVAVSLADAVTDHGARVALVAAGPDAPLGPGRFQAPDATPKEAGRMVNRLLVDADAVVVSASTLDRSSAGLVWAPLADATLIVARRHRTQTADVVRTVEAVREAGAAHVAAVLLGRSR
jgi:capsular polysaccharide biosynthesis protein